MSIWNGTPPAVCSPIISRHFSCKPLNHLGGAIREREPGRYRITHVPAAIREGAKSLGTVLPVLRQYERVCFDKDLISVAGKPLAQFICPGHPLLDTVIDLVWTNIARPCAMARCWSIPPTPARNHAFSSSWNKPSVMPTQHPISQEVHFVEIDETETIRAGGYAPYLDYRPATPAELNQVRSNHFS